MSPESSGKKVLKQLPRETFSSKDSVLFRQELNENGRQIGINVYPVPDGLAVIYGYEEDGKSVHLRWLLEINEANEIIGIKGTCHDVLTNYKAEGNLFGADVSDEYIIPADEVFRKLGFTSVKGPLERFGDLRSVTSFRVFQLLEANMKKNS